MTQCYDDVLCGGGKFMNEIVIMQSYSRGIWRRRTIVFEWKWLVESRKEVPICWFVPTNHTTFNAPPAMKLKIHSTEESTTTTTTPLVLPTTCWRQSQTFSGQALLIVTNDDELSRVVIVFYQVNLLLTTTQHLIQNPSIWINKIIALYALQKKRPSYG